MFDEAAVFPLTPSYQTGDSLDHGGEHFATRGGKLYYVAHSDTPLMRWRLEVDRRQQEDISTLTRFIRARGGGQRGFRFKDPRDFTSRQDGRSTSTYLDSFLGIGDGVTRTFQLQKVYTDGITSVVRPIYKPIPGTVSVGIQAVESNPGDFSVDATTGIVTFNTAPTLGLIVTGGFDYHVPVSCGPDADRGFGVQFESYNSESAINLDLIELAQDDATEPSRPITRGSRVADNPGGYVAVERTGARLWHCTDNGTLGWRLPNPQGMTGGGHWFTLSNGTGSIKSVQHPDGTLTFNAVSPGELVEVHLLYDTTTGQYTWIL